MRGQTKDLTQGRPARQIFFFALPLVFGTVFQQLYSFADTIIIGRLVGEAALAAVGVTYGLSFLILGFVQGAMAGFGVPLSQAFGARDTENVHRYLWNGLFLCALLSVFLSLTTTLAAPLLLSLIATPADIFDMACLYIRIIFLGMTFTFLYNYSASVLRALGNSKSPFYNLLFSSGLNIVLDLLFVGAFGMGVAGAALATVISQGVSALLNGRVLLFKTGFLRFKRGEVAVSAKHMKRLCVVGLPMGFEYSISAMGAIVMQYAINGLGSAVIAGQTAGEKIRQMFTLPTESVGMAMATYAAQNYGAGRSDRIKQGLRDGLCIQYIYCLAVFLFIRMARYALVGLVLGDTGTPAGVLAVEYLSRMSPLFFVLGTLMIVRNTLQGMGFSLEAVFSGFGELLGRSLGAFLAVGCGFGFIGICYANPLAWGLALFYCALRLARHLRGMDAGAGQIQL